MLILQIQINCLSDSFYTLNLVAPLIMPQASFGVHFDRNCNRLVPLQPKTCTSIVGTYK